jgi:hypothetical protein
VIAFLLSGQGPSGPLYAVAQDAARQLTPEVGQATADAAEQWVAERRAAEGGN